MLCCIQNCRIGVPNCLCSLGILCDVHVIGMNLNPYVVTVLTVNTR